MSKLRHIITIVVGTIATLIASAAAANQSTEQIVWAWPAQASTIISPFTPSTKGIDISGPMDSAVYAAADGKVMYAGDGVRGFGNLILIGHGPNYVSSYSHNKTLLVKVGQQVKRKQLIAKMGQSDADRVKLHFQIRVRGTPRDPLLFVAFGENRTIPVEKFAAPVNNQANNNHSTNSSQPSTSANTVQIQPYPPLPRSTLLLER